MPVGHFDKLLADNSIIGCVVWEWELSEGLVYVLQSVSNYVCIHVHVQHECRHIYMNVIMHGHMHVQMHVHMHRCAHACMYACKCM